MSTTTSNRGNPDRGHLTGGRAGVGRASRDRSRLLRYLWLVYLGALFFQPAFDTDAGVWDWFAVAALIAVFLPVYLATFTARGDRRRLQLIAALAVLALAGSLVNSGATVFAIYAAAAAGHLSTTARSVRTIAALEVVVVAALLVSPVPWPWRWYAFGPALLFTLVIGAASVVDAERERTHRRLRRADEEIERLATIAERERIARDLHDLLGHTLSVVVLKSELAGRLIATDPDRAGAEIRDVERIGRQALAEVRAAVAGYRAAGLDAELTGARRALDAAGVTLDLEADPPPLAPQGEAALALAVRECVTNVVRHAHARHVTITIRAEPGQGERAPTGAVLEVIDDGRGASGPDGAGLTGMRERISGLGGTVVRTHGPGGAGTRVRVTLPTLIAPGSMRAVKP